DLRLLAALDPHAHAAGARVVDAPDLGGEVVAHAEALHDDLPEELRPAHDPAARVDRRDVQDPVVDDGVGQEGEATGEPPAVPDEERAQARVDGRRVVELELRAHAAPVQVPD